MPFNGSGVYSPPSLPGSFNPAISGQAATPTDWNTLLTDLSTALSTTLTKDGQSTPTANIGFGGFRITNVGNASALTDATTAGQVQNARHTYAIDTGTADNYAIAPLPACAAYAVGQSFQFFAIHTSLTTTPALAVSGLPAGTIKWADGSALPIGAIKINGGYEVMVAAVAAGTPTFHLQTPLPVSLTGTTTQKFTTGTAATYTTPTGAKTIKVRMWAGGGGGAGVDAGPTAVAGSDGGTTTFNSINAAGGKGGATVTGTVGGAGGTGGSGTTNVTIRMPGFVGESGSVNATPSGSGGGPGGGSSKATAAAGGAGVANSSGGGAGAFGTDGGNSLGSPGGGSGEYVELVINSPAATYTYTVGAGGAGGVAAQAGGAGGSGVILVEEQYNL